MTASVKIETDSRSDALLAPNAALRWKPAGAVAKDQVSGRSDRMELPG
jgi:hypothetical protein